MHANMMMNNIKNAANGLSNMTRIRQRRGKYFWMRKPMANGTTKANTYDAICEYGVATSASVNITSPRVKSQNGNMAESKNDQYYTHKN